jgi:6-phosphogluconolactonase/glucosamine-6-phosphate isomerase/deaminase
MEVAVSDDPAGAAAELISARLRSAAADRGRATIAVSGGGTAPALFDRLAAHDVDWSTVEAWQVDERIAPDGDPARNATQLDVLAWRIHPMPVTDHDPVAAADRYAEGLPEWFDVVHLGVGDDGHTASWPPGDPVVTSPRACVVVGMFRGHARMTLTPVVVNAARARIVLAGGAAKAVVIGRWLGGATDVPVAHVARADTWVFLDRAASAEAAPPAIRPRPER